MLEVFNQVENENFHCITIEKKEDLWPGFKSFLSKDRLSGEADARPTTSEGAGAAT